MAVGDRSLPYITVTRNLTPSRYEPLGTLRCKFGHCLTRSTDSSQIQLQLQRFSTVEVMVAISESAHQASKICHGPNGLGIHQERPRASHFNRRKRAFATHLNLRICLNLKWRSNSRRRPLCGAAGAQMDRFRYLCFFTARPRAHGGATASARAGRKRAHWDYLIWRGEFALCVVS